MERIVVALDYSDLTTKVIDQSIKLAKAHESLVYLVHCEPEEPHYVQDIDNDEFLRELQHKIDSIRRSFNDEGVNLVFCQQISTDNIGRSLLNQCRRFNADLLIIGAHQHNKVRRLFGDGVVDQLLTKCPIPLLLVR